MRIDEVPDDVYRQLRDQARAAGQPLGDYLRERLGDLARAAADPAPRTSADAARTAASVPLQMRRRIEREHTAPARSTE
ncbi:hypothetical protein GCM10027174_36150 [Salinifilum aidingensis]